MIYKWYYLKCIVSGIQQGTYKSFIPMFTTLEEYVQVDVSTIERLNIVCNSMTDSAIYGLIIKHIVQLKDQTSIRNYISGFPFYHGL